MPEEPKKPVPEKRAPPKVAKIEEPPPTKGKQNPPGQKLETCHVLRLLAAVFGSHHLYGGYRCMLVTVVYYCLVFGWSITYLM